MSVFGCGYVGFWMWICRFFDVGMSVFWMWGMSVFVCGYVGFWMWVCHIGVCGPRRFRMWSPPHSRWCLAMWVCDIGVCGPRRFRMWVCDIPTCGFEVWNMPDSTNQPSYLLPAAVLPRVPSTEAL